MRLKSCRICGTLFRTDKTDHTLCPDCLTREKATTIRPRTCRQCGASFDGGPRAWYCPDCRAERKKDAMQRFRQKGAARPLGSIDQCVVCGGDYVVNSARQKYCPSCAPAAVREADRAASIAWNTAHPERKQELRQQTKKICVICGGTVPKGTQRVTCSPECEQKRRQLAQADADLRRGHRNSPSKIKRLDDKKEDT